MRYYADESYLHARIYAMKSRLLSLKDYASMARSRNESLIFETEDSGLVTAEEILFREQIADIIRLAETTKIYTPLFLAFFRQFEAFNAKLIMAKAFGLHPLEQWYDIGQYAVLDRNLSDERKTLQDIRPLLKGTYLDKAFDDASTYEQAEMIVDECVLRNMFSASLFFNPQAKHDFQYLIGRRAAVLSVIISLRLKKTYQWDTERINAYLEGFHDIFDGKGLTHLNAVEKQLNSHLERQQAMGAQEPDVLYMEHYLEQNYYNWISAAFHRDFHSVWCVAAYLWLLFYQIKNIFRIVEGRRFGFPPERILSRIICNA